MPALQQVCEADDAQLSSFAGVIIIVSIYQRCFDHSQAWLQQPSYAFWDAHYAIDRLIILCRDSLLASHISTHNQETSDVLALLLRMSIGALEIKLHEVAWAKIEKEKLPSILTTEAISRCQAATTYILGAIQVGQQLKGSASETFRRASVFYAKTITKAIESCVWMIDHPENKVTTHINVMRILSDSLRELVDPRHLRLGFLEQVEAKIADAKRSKKKAFLYH